MTAKPITLGSTRFKTKTEATNHFRKMLSKGGPNDKILDPLEVEQMSLLFYSREKKVSELGGRTIVGWGREKTSHGQCFAALLNTGEKLHFSYLKSVSAISAQTEARHSICF
ncbi:hypothetical protein WG622_11655 [Cognatishimia sp. D5M38]|jgi:hypothetical protein|uniref:Uncharacterized protein n=1 Tax=Cognatishimia coralii TaxID=3083254 RepID=A0ABU8QHK1_9RHOB